MIEAMKEAKKAVALDEVSIGAVLVKNDKVYTRAFNNRIKSHLVTGHAEILVINKACQKLKYWKLDDCELYVTLKPCKMCMEVIREAGIKVVYYLIDPLDIKENRYKNEVRYIKNDGNLLALEYRQILREFFSKKRLK